MNGALKERATAMRLGAYLPQTANEAAELVAYNTVLGLHATLWHPFRESLTHAEQRQLIDNWRADVEATLVTWGSKR